jgi:hypothetical protein
VQGEQELCVERLHEDGVEAAVATKAKNGSRDQPVFRPISGVNVKISR